MTTEEIKKDIEKLGSIRRTCPKCHKRMRVKPDRVTCPECGGKYFQSEKETKVKPTKIIAPKVAKPIEIKKPEVIDRSEVIESCFYIKSSRGADAKAILTDDGIQVLKGSVAAPDLAPSTTKTIRNKISSLRDLGIIDSSNQFPKDYIFKSPSMAASVIQGRNANGLTDWKNADGKSIKEVRNG